MRAPSDNVAPRPTLWAAFQHRDFFIMWTSGVAVSLSMVLRTLVAAQWLYDETGSAAQLGLLGIVQLLQLPTTLLGGSLADRINRKMLMIMTQAAAFLMLFLLTVLASSGALAPWHIFAMTGISGIVNTLGGAARPAMLPRVVSRDLLTQAVAVLTITNQLATIGTPLIFWLLYENVGVAGSFGVAAAIAAVSTIFPFLIRTSGKPDTQPGTTTWASLAEGFKFVAKHPLLPGLYGLDLGVTIVSFYRQLFPVFARQLYGLGASGTGLLNACSAAGSILGTLLVFYADRFPRKGLLVLTTSLIYGLVLIAFGLNRVFVVGLALVAILGMMDSVGMTMRQAIVQLTTPDQLLGRASSVRNFAAMGSNNLGQIEVGLMAAIIGAGNTMVLGGLLSVAFVLLLWRFVPSVQKYEFKPEMAVQPRAHA